MNCHKIGSVLFACAALCVASLYPAPVDLCNSRTVLWHLVNAGWVILSCRELRVSLGAAARGSRRQLLQHEAAHPTQRRAPDGRHAHTHIHTHTHTNTHTHTLHRETAHSTQHHIADDKKYACVHTGQHMMSVPTSPTQVLICKQCRFYSLCCSRVSW